MTLVEIVVGLAILATVLTGILAVKARTTRQARLTERRREAVVAADALLASWWQNPAAFPRSGTGNVGDHAGLVWKTQTLVNPSASALGADVVRVEIIDAASSRDTGALVALEVAVPQGGNNASRVYAH